MMAYSWSPPTPTIPLIADSRYSSLHQERSYLLSALAAEESRAEGLSRALETTRAKPQMAEAERELVHSVGNLRKTASTIARKLKKCYKSERAMANNLAAVTAQMQMLEQYQWRKAQFDYSQRMQETSIYGMALGLQDMRLESPIYPAYGYPCTPYHAAASNAMPSPNATLPSMPATPTLQPQSVMSVGSAWNTPLPTPYHQQFQMPAGFRTPYNSPQSGMLADCQSMDVQYLPYALPIETAKRSRRMSLPNPARKSSWHSPECQRDISEEPMANENIELGRRLSMVGGTSVRFIQDAEDVYMSIHEGA
jgi:hypothetical protein